MVSNPIILALIGLPTIMGVYFRFKNFNEESFYKSCAISSLVMTAIGIGFAIDRFSNPPESIISHTRLGIGVLMVLMVIIV